MFQYLLNPDGEQRPEARGCYQVTDKGGKPLKCKCLNRIGADIRSADDAEAKWDMWRPIFTRFSQLCRLIIHDPYSPATMVQVMYEFDHIIGRDICNKVKAFVLQSPASLGPLMMDWNGLFELGGHDYRPAYATFYQTWITDPISRSGLQLTKFYVLEVVIKHQTNLNTFLDCIAVAAKDEIQLVILDRPMIMDHRLEQGYYITDSANFNYYTEKQGPIVKQKSADRKINLPPCFRFFKSMESFLVVAHPSIPHGMAPVDPVELNPICIALFQTDGRRSTVGPNAVLIAGNVGVIRSDVTMAPSLLPKLQEIVSWDGSRHHGRVRPYNFETNGLVHLYQEFGVPVDVVEISTFNQQIMAASRSLLPQINPEIHYDLKFSAECHICPCPDLSVQFVWKQQPPSRPPEDFLRQLEGIGVYSFFGVLPLQKDGKFVMVYPEQGTSPYHQGKLVYVPYKKLLLFPMQIFWVDSIRTSVAGNPSMYLTIFLIPRQLDPVTVCNAIQQIVDSLHQELVPTPPSTIGKLGEFIGF